MSRSSTMFLRRYFAHDLERYGLGEKVAHLLPLRSQIPEIRGVRRDPQRYTLHDLHAVTLEALDLRRVVGQQPGPSHAEVEQHVGGGPVVAHVLRQPQRMVRLDRVEALLLERVGRDLLGEADAATFLPQVEKDAVAMLLQEPQAIGQLFSAVATGRPEDVARKAFRVYADQNRLAVVDRSQGERHVLFVIGAVVDEHIEGAVAGGKARLGGPSGSWRRHTRSFCRAALSAARKPAFEWVPSQKGFFAESPQRHNATVARSARNSLPSASTSETGPFTRYGPLSRAVIFVC